MWWKQFLHWFLCVPKRADHTIKILIRVRRMDDTIDDLITTVKESSIRDFRGHNIMDVKNVREVWIFKQVFHHHRSYAEDFDIEKLDIEKLDIEKLAPLAVAAASGMNKPI